MARPARFERATYALEGRDYEYFGNDFGNKGVVLPQTLVIPIDLAEAVSNNLYVWFKRTLYRVRLLDIPLSLCLIGKNKLSLKQ